MRAGENLAAETGFEGDNVSPAANWREGRKTLPVENLVAATHHAPRVPFEPRGLWWKTSSR